MTEAAAIRYLITKGWNQVDGEWFSLKGTDNVVCLDTAYQMQRNMESVYA
jgi:hypothetical protein